MTKEKMIAAAGRKAAAPRHLPNRLACDAIVGGSMGSVTIVFYCWHGLITVAKETAPTLKKSSIRDGRSGGWGGRGARSIRPANEQIELWGDNCA
jgi:hypothetical protein